MMKERVNMGSDRISDLPEHLKQSILSLLDIRDAVRTSVLSKRWRHEWNWLPCLTFDIQCLPKELELVKGVSKRWKRIISQEIEAYIDFLERTLIRRCSKVSNTLESLHLFVPLSSTEQAPRVDLWLACVSRCDVRKLTLDMSSVTTCYRLPQSVLASRYLTSLKLVNCKIMLEYPNTIELLSLRKMSLWAVYVDKRTLKKLIVGCPAIRKLSLIHCVGFKKLEILGVPQLELEVVNVLDSTGLERVTIDAVHLQAFSMEGCNLPCQINVASCKNIKCLTLGEVAITDDQLSFHLDELHLLEDLYLVKCDALKHFKVAAQSLKLLVLKCCTGLVKAEICAPILESFSYWGVDMLSLFSLNAPALASASVNLSCRRTSADWYVSFIEFLACFNAAETVTLFVGADKGMVIPEVLREMLIPPLFNVKHIKVEVSYLIETHSLAEAIGSILWLSLHPDTITISSILAYSAHDVKVYFIYNEPRNGEPASNHGCCSLIPINCWRHSLKDVKIENLNNPRDGADLMTLFETTETLELIERL